MARCPRCGESMNGGICDNCRFPIRLFKKNVPPIKKVKGGFDGI